MFLIPEIIKEHPLLRAPREEDFEKMKEYMTRERAKFVGGSYDEVSTWNGLLKSLGYWHLRGYAYCHIEHRDRICMTGAPGFLHHFDFPEPQLYWNVHHDLEGQGIAFEAALALRTYSADKLYLSVVLSYINYTNTRPVRLTKTKGEKLKLMGNDFDAYRHPMANKS